MNSADRIQLEKMIQANDAADNTAQIRDLKHSMLIHGDVATLLNLKRDYARLAKTNPDQFDMMCVNRCAFLFNNYTDIFNKVATSPWMSMLCFKSRIWEVLSAASFA